jgi:4-amino-4-deoxy-L-arabinose transferase-like glycosyltransferase
MIFPGNSSTGLVAQDKSILLRSEDSVAYALIALGVFLRVLSFFFSDNAGGDAGAHAALAGEWLRHPRVTFVFDTYPPGHFWLIGLFALMVHNVVWAGRLLSLVAGISSLYFVWRLARLLYGPSAGIFSIAVFSLYSLHIGYSTTSSAEVPYLFFLLVGTYFLFCGIGGEKGRIGRLLISGACFSVAESIRYEAWIFFFGLVVSLGLASLWKRRFSSRMNLFSLLVWVAAAGAWPAFMMAYSYHAFGDPMHLVTLNRMRVTHSLATTSQFHQLAVMPVALLLSVSPVAVVAGVVGLGLSFYSGEAGIFAAATLIFATIEVYEVLTGGLLATARYTITLGAMLCVLSGFGFDRIVQWRTPAKSKLALAVIVVMLILNCALLVGISATSGGLANEVASVSPRLRYQPQVADVGSYLRQHLKSGDAVIFDDYNLSSNILAEASGLPVPTGRRAFLANKKNDLTVEGYLVSEHPRFLVYSDQGTLRQWFDLRPDCGRTQMIGGIEFRCAFVGQVYRVYELSYR